MNIFFEIRIQSIFIAIRLRVNFPSITFTVTKRLKKQKSRKNYGAKNRKNASGRFLNGKSGLKRELFYYYCLPEHDVV